MKRNLRKSKLGKNTILNLLTKASEAVLYFATDIMAANLLDEKTYGEWCFFYAIATMVFLAISFGINHSTRIKVAREAENTDKQSAYIVTGFRLRIAVSLIIFGMIIIAGWFAAPVLGYPQKYPQLRGMFLMGAFLCLLNSFSEFYKAIYIGMQKFDYVFYTGLLEFGGFFVFGIGLLAFFKSVYALEVGYIAALGLVSVLGICFLWKKQAPKDRLRNEGMKMRNEILSDALPFLITSCGTLVFAEIDTFMIGALSTAEDVGAYSIAKNLVSKSTHVNYAICMATMTALAYIGVSDLERKKKLFHRLLKLNMAVAVTITAGLFFVGPYVIVVLYKNAAAGTMIKYLSIYFFIYVVNSFFSIFLDYQGKVKIRSIIFLVSMLFNVLLNGLLIPKWGAVGAAVATCVSMMPYDLFLILYTSQIFRKLTNRKEMPGNH